MARDRRGGFQGFRRLSHSNSHRSPSHRHSPEKDHRTANAMTQADLKDPAAISTETLCHNLDKMRTQDGAESLCDFSLICNGRSLPCHKAVLVARSDYFKTLFARHDFKENDTNEMKLTEDEHEYADAFLSFIYGNIPDWDRVEGPEEAVTLFRMADKYLVEDLKDVCEGWLVDYANHASLEDCIDIFGLVTDYGDLEELRQALGRNIVRNRDSITKEMLKDIHNIGPDFLGEILK